jgi:NAD-dependent SIR2 family protein deacetylase
MLTVSPNDRVLFLTGAGVSAESGIPTFRGVRGLWRDYRIEEVASPHSRATHVRNFSNTGGLSAPPLGSI